MRVVLVVFGFIAFVGALVAGARFAAGTGEDGSRAGVTTSPLTRPSFPAPAPAQPVASDRMQRFAAGVFETRRHFALP